MKPYVLLVEPAADLAEVLAKALAAQGINSQTAYSAQSAIAKADKQKPSVIVLELVITRHNGLEFIHEFRSYADWLDIPIIIYSRVSAEELGLKPELLINLGIVKHFYKPTTTLSQLVEAVKAHALTHI